MVEFRNVEEMTGEERAAEMGVLGGPLPWAITFDAFHERVEQLVGRPVWTHEMGLNWEGLTAEARERQHPTMEEIIDLIPEEKRIVVVVGADAG